MSRLTSNVPILSQIEELTADIPGWAPVDQMYTLYNMAVTSSNIVGGLLEIGSWCGKTSVVLGHAAAFTNSYLHCVDLFPEKSDWVQNADRSYSMEVTIGKKTYGGYGEQTVWEEPFEQQILPVYERYGSVRDAFNKNITKNELGSFVEAFRSDSSVLEHKDLGPYRLAFIDGDHGFDAVLEDISRVHRRLSIGGWGLF